MVPTMRTAWKPRLSRTHPKAGAETDPHEAWEMSTYVRRGVPAAHCRGAAAHGCVNLKTETIQGATHYVAEEKPEAVAELIERHAARTAD